MFTVAATSSNVSGSTVDILVLVFSSSLCLIQVAKVAEILAEYGTKPHEYAPIVNALRKRPQAWFELGLEKPETKKSITDRIHHCYC
ncbi:Uncharacterized protein TCM_027518 [Theobroma cacao]|uniref:Uncharacterized protein n=1 Tax=Theobroma cacao TaxID=3641 RepID=A0A061G9M4_THECC|nr:Uncharacterized protein TCM_027518 [Theobroma cacao]